MKTKTWTAAIILCILMLNCASSVTSKKYNDDNPYNYKTYAYLQDTGLNASMFNRESGALVDDNAVQKMKEKMGEMGFSMDSNNPDMVILISETNAINSTLRKDGRNSTASQGTSASSSPYSGAGSTTGKRYSSSNSNTTSTRPYQNGNMVVEIFNNSTKNLIWAGVAKDFKSDIAGQLLTVRMVDEIFNKFPKQEN